MILPNTVLHFGNLESNSKKYYGSSTASSMDVDDLLGEEIEDEEISEVNVEPKIEKVMDTVEPKIVVETKIEDEPSPEEFSEIEEEPSPEPEEKIVAVPKPAPAENMANKLKTKLLGKKQKTVVDDEDFEDEEEKPVPYVVPVIETITHLSKYLRNENFKFTVFNIKETLINYLEMFGERKVARHILDQDAHAFYEIHASYIPGGIVYRVLSKLGFKPIHPTDLEADYPKDMSYDVAMSNGKLYINVFGGLQQHAHAEETVIRNLYARERMRYTQVPAPALGISASSALEFSNEKVSKNLLLASMQSHSLGKVDLSKSFFNEAMDSPGIDSLIISMSEDYLEEDSAIFDDYQEQPEYEQSTSAKYKLYSEKKFKKSIPKLAEYTDEELDVDDIFKVV